MACILAEPATWLGPTAETSRRITVSVNTLVYSVNIRYVHSNSGSVYSSVWTSQWKPL